MLPAITPLPISGPMSIPPPRIIPDLRLSASCNATNETTRVQPRIVSHTRHRYLCLTLITHTGT
jgi:hypothetical protein